MQQISSVNNATIKKLAKLKQKKYRDEENRYLIEGFHLFEEAVKAGKKYQYVLGTEEAPVSYTHLTLPTISHV